MRELAISKRARKENLFP